MSIKPSLTDLSHYGFAPRDLGPFNTLGLPCLARNVLDLTDPAQLPALSLLASAGQDFLVLGGGSNVVLPALLSRPVLCNKFRGIRLLEQTSDAWIVQAAAGENWHRFVTHCVEQGWGGLENLALIPGTVGAAPVQNIGAYGVELSTRIESVTAWHLAAGRELRLSTAQCAFGYRDSLFKQEPAGTWIITSVTFRLRRPWRAVANYPDIADHPSIAPLAPGELNAQRIYDAICQVRRNKLPDPALLGNAGSFFKNPVVTAAQYKKLQANFARLVAYPQADGQFKLAAGWLIDQCGFKGVRRGCVGVHDRQALVLVNYGGAQAQDVLAIAKDIASSVLDRFGVALETEPVIVES